MTGKREFVDYLKDILDSAQKAEGFVGNMDFEQFERDEKTIFAVIRALEVIGEAAGHIPQHVRIKHPDVPWREMAGTRNKVIHEYFGVNLRRAFDTVRVDLPPLQARIAQILREMEGIQKGE